MIIGYILEALVPILIVIYVWRYRHSLSDDVIWDFTIIISFLITILTILFLTDK
jgi:hypothetical protein